MCEEGIISKERAIQLVDPYSVNQILLPCFDTKALAEAKKISSGVNASPGAAVGKIVFDTEEAAQRGEAGEKVILVRIETCPDDIHGMAVAQGVLTLRGGATSHAAVVAKGMGKPCVSGCEDIKIDLDNETLTAADGTVYRKDDIISLDGGKGLVMAGAVKLVEAQIDDNWNKFFSWVDEVRQIKVEANADTPKDIINALKFGAEGVGLCRTEHMFMDPERLPWVQKMIIAGTPEARKEALAKLLPMQYEDFYAMFKELGDKPLTVRLLDPPLHEFLPSKEDLIDGFDVSLPTIFPYNLAGITFVLFKTSRSFSPKKSVMSQKCLWIKSFFMPNFAIKFVKILCFNSNFLIIKMA